MLSGTCTMLLNYSGCTYQRKVVFVYIKNRFASFAITLRIKTGENRQWLHPNLFQFLQQDVAKTGTHKAKPPSQDSAHNVQHLTTVHTILNKISSCSVSNASCFKKIFLFNSVYFHLCHVTYNSTLTDQAALYHTETKSHDNNVDICNKNLPALCMLCMHNMHATWWFTSCCFPELQWKTSKIFHSNNRRYHAG